MILGDGVGDRLRSATCHRGSRVTTRIDVHVKNDSGAILLMLEGDDTFPARVVVGGELTEAERDE